MYMYMYMYMYVHICNPTPLYRYCILPIGSDEVKCHVPLNTYARGSKRIDIHDRNG